MSEPTNAAEGWGEQDEPSEVTALKPVFAKLIVRQLDQNQALSGDERRAADMEIYKAQMRAAFLTNPLATAEDFERLWPRLRDDDLCEHAVLTYGQVMGALSQDVDEGKLLHDYVSEGDNPQSKTPATGPADAQNDTAISKASG